MDNGNDYLFPRSIVLGVGRGEQRASRSKHMNVKRLVAHSVQRNAQSQ